MALFVLSLFVRAQDNSFKQEDEFEFFKNHQTSNTHKEHKEEFQNFKARLNAEFTAFKKAQDDALREFKEEIGAKWPTKEVGSSHKWVEYSKNYDEKRSINYATGEIEISVISKDPNTAKQKILKAFDEIYKKDVCDATKDDILEKKIAEKLKRQRKDLNSKDKLIADVINENDKKKIQKTLEHSQPKHIEYNGNNIYKVQVELPVNAISKKAKKFYPLVIAQSSKSQISPSLIYAVIHSESSFNPMARSFVPAYGLMQIVPQSAGRDAYMFLYGQKKLLSSDYLYVPKNNILIGATYLQILYFNYLKDIKDPKSRVYATIAAYNTGAGNVACAFVGKADIKKASIKINSMSSTDVYDHLIKFLPHTETKQYLKKVSSKMDYYEKRLP